MEYRKPGLEKYTRLEVNATFNIFQKLEVACLEQESEGRKRQPKTPTVSENHTAGLSVIFRRCHMLV